MSEPVPSARALATALPARSAFGLRGGAQEIGRDPALLGYGVALSVVHVVTFAHWGTRFGIDVPALLAARDTAICWPFFERCDEWRVLGEGAARALLWSYGAAGVVCAAAYLRGRALAGGRLLLLLSLLKWWVIAQDFRLGGNYHYMAFVSTAAFLFLPAKRDLGRYLVVAYYVGAAALKFDYDWLSGAALHRAALLHAAALRVATTYVVLLETLGVLGLLCRSRLLFWSALAQLALFHAYSVSNVGTPYPLFMACLLALFPLARARERTEPVAPGPLVRLLLGRVPPTHYLALVAYALAQLFPVSQPGDPALTGRGRSFALTMFDARTTCDTLAVASLPGGAREQVELTDVELAPRIQCDPIAFAGRVRATCRRLRARAPAADLEVYVVAKRASDVRARPLIAARDACEKPLVASLWRRTSWILP